MRMCRDQGKEGKGYIAVPACGGSLAEAKRMIYIPVEYQGCVVTRHHLIMEDADACYLTRLLMFPQGTISCESEAYKAGMLEPFSAQTCCAAYKSSTSCWQ
eukprot:1142519-Pelagomonas_calceolata.AAC.4